MKKQGEKHLRQSTLTEKATTRHTAESSRNTRQKLSCDACVLNVLHGASAQTLPPTTHPHIRTFMWHLLGTSSVNHWGLWGPMGAYGNLCAPKGPWRRLSSEYLDMYYSFGPQWIPDKMLLQIGGLRPQFDPSLSLIHI